MDLEFCAKHLKLITKDLPYCPECLIEDGANIILKEDNYYIALEEYFSELMNIIKARKTIIKLSQNFANTFFKLKNYIECLNNVSEKDFPSLDENTQKIVLGVCKDFKQDLIKILEGERDGTSIE